jgi:hypothetical protein
MSSAGWNPPLDSDESLGSEHVKCYLRHNMTGCPRRIGRSVNSVAELSVYKSRCKLTTVWSWGCWCRVGTVPQARYRVKSLNILNTICSWPHYKY